MKKLLLTFCLLSVLCVPVSGAEYIAPQIPESSQDMMPSTSSFGEGLMELMNKALEKVVPEYHRAVSIGLSVIGIILFISCVGVIPADVHRPAEIAGICAVSALLFSNANTMVDLGSTTIQNISEYGKLLLPVMTAALAAQGGLTSSAALYAGTALIGSFLNSLISGLLLPMVYYYLALAVGNAVIGEQVLKNIRDLIKSFMGWCLKTLLTVFTTYMGITGVVSGTTDAAALKATKVTIASVVPVVGGILSDASEAVLVSAGLARNAAGIYGILAILALYALPFLRIGVHYLALRATAGLCSVIGSKSVVELIGDFSSAMGLILAMTGSVCLLQLISTVCFLKGVVN